MGENIIISILTITIKHKLKGKKNKSLHKLLNL